MSTINNSISGYTITGSADADSIDNIGNEVEILAGDGNDTITNYSTTNSLRTGKDVSINAGAGDDSIENHGANVYIDAENGDDVINNFSNGQNATIKGGDGNDSIRNSGEYSVLIGGAGNDTLSNTNLGANSTLDGGAGDDSVLAYNANNIYLRGGLGNDTVYSGGVAQGITINGGAGNDTLIGDSVNTYGVIYQYSNGEGADRIYNWNDNDTLSIGGDEIYETLISGNNVNVSLMSGSVTVVNAKDKTLNIVGGHLLAENEFINTTTNKTITGTSAGDSISNYAGGVKIYAGAGNDTIYSQVLYTVNGAYGYVTIDGGAGNDSIYADDANLSINGGAGNDTISFYGNRGNITIKGDTGNDYINNLSTNHAVIYQYEEGDGNDSITNYSSNDTISIGGSVNYSTLTSGNNLIVNVGSGSITLVNAKGKTLNIVGGHLLAENEFINTTTNKTINGTSAGDSISNYAGGVKIYAGDGNDTIYDQVLYTVNSAYGYVTIDGGAGNDSIYADDPNLSINGGSGNDTISFYGNRGNVTIKGDTGNDYINNLSTNHAVIYQYEEGDGNDSITNYSSNDTISIGGSVNYSTLTSGNNLIVNVGSGSITLVNAKGKTLNIKGGNFSGTKIITNYTKNTVVSGTANSDTIYNYAGGVKINAGAGDDTIFNSTSKNYTINNTYGYVTIDGGAGNDSIYSNDLNVSINGGAGDDTVSLIGSNSKITIKGGAGNDLISKTGTVGSIYQYASGDGYDTISGYTANDTISIGSSTKYDTLMSGSNKVVSLASGSITLLNASSTTLNITGGSFVGKNIITNYTKNTLISGTSNVDSIRNYAGGVTISAGAGNDNIYSSTDKNYTINNSYGYVTIDGGAGNDTIYNNDSYVSISGGLGNDSIYSSAGIYNTISGGMGNDTINGYYSYSSISGNEDKDIISLESSSQKNTINGGSGDDTIYNNSGGNIIQYSSGYGNDVVYGLGTKDTFHVTYGTIGSYSVSGSDVVLNIGAGSVTLKNAQNKSFYLKTPGKNAASTIISSNGIPGLTVKGDVVKAETSFTGNEIDLGFFSSTVTKVDASALSRGISITGTAAANSIKGGKGADYIEGGAGNDTVSLGGGNDTYVYSGGYDVIQDYTSWQDKIYLPSVSILSSYLSGSDVVLNLSNSRSLTIKNGKEKYITIIDSKGNSTNSKYGYFGYNTKRTEITLNADFNSTLFSSFYESTVKLIDATKTSKTGYINGNSQNNTIKGGSGADYIHGYLGNNLLYGNAGNDTINGGFTDTIYGGDGNDFIAGNNGNDKLYGESGKDTLYGDDGNDTIDGGGGEDFISGGYGNDSIRGGYGNDTIYGGDGNDYIYGENGNDILYGGDGNDTLIGGIDNDTMYGGAGSDIFVVASIYDDDVIADFTSNDRLSLVGGGSVTSVNFNGSDMNFTIKDSAAIGHLTLKSVKDTEVSLGSNIYYNYLTYDSKKTSATLGASFKGTLKASDYATSIKTIDAELNRNAIKIVGNSQNNVIYTGSGKTTVDGGAGNDYIWGSSGNDSLFGGAGNDTLYGNSGNNTLTGGAGNDVFVVSTYTGDDVITDFSSGDKISLRSGVVASASLKGSDMIFELYNGSLTVKNGKNKEISVGNFIYYNNLTYDSKKTSATIGAGFSGTLNASDYSSSIKTIDNTYGGKATKIIGNSQNNVIYAGSGKLTVDGGAGNDLIVAGSGGSSLYGGAGNDTLWGSTGNDTLTGGAGNDVFIFSSYMGSDVITDFSSGDKISLRSGSITSSSVSGSDLVLKVTGGNTLTVKNGKDKDISVGSYIYHNNLTYNAKKTEVTINAAGSYGRDDIESTVTKISAYNLSKGVNITSYVANRMITGGSGGDYIVSYGGNSTVYGEGGNDTLFGGNGNDILYGGTGNDTLYGYPGNDTLHGGSGKDLFWNSSGNNTILDYTAGDDKIRFVAALTSTTYSGNDVIFHFGSDSLTVKNGNGKKISIINTNGKTTTQTYSSSSARTLDLFNDDNFITDAASIDDISEITADNYSVTEIQPAESDTFAQDKNILTFAKDK